MPHHRPNARALALLAGFGAVWLACAPIHAEELRVFGDGSNANNADLGVPVPTDCGPDRLCPDVAGAATGEVGDAFFTPSFALTLRGAYQHDGTSGQPLFEILPSASFSHAGRRANLTLDADATIEGPENGTGRLSGLNFGAEGDYQLDRDMRLSASGGLTFSQDSLNDFGVDATVAQMPINLSGSVDGTLERRFGRLGVSVMAGAARSQWTDTVLVDTSHVDNAERNETSVNLGLRGSYELTPILAAFAQVDGTRLVYDAPSSGLGVKLDGYSLAARVGLGANWRDVLTGEASLGYGVRTFDDASLSPVGAWLANASVSFSPDETLTYTGELTTGFEGVDTGSLASVAVTNSVEGSVNYRVNSRVTLRGSLSAARVTYLGTPESELSYGAGAGVDYRLSKYATVSADYDYAHYAATGDTPVDRQTVSVGLTLSR